MCVSACACVCLSLSTLAATDCIILKVFLLHLRKTSPKSTSMLFGYLTLLFAVWDRLKQRFASQYYVRKHRDSFFTGRGHGSQGSWEKLRASCSSAHWEILSDYGRGKRGLLGLSFPCFWINVMYTPTSLNWKFISTEALVTKECVHLILVQSTAMLPWTSQIPSDLRS